MTTSPTPFSDEELSADVDGELDPNRAGQLAADPGARARREELAAVAARVGTPVDPLDAAVVDELIAGAIDAPVAPAAPHRARRGPQPWLVAAAVALLVAVGLGLIWSGRSADDQDQASTGSTLEDAGADAAGAGSAADREESETAAESSTGAMDSSAAPTSTIPSSTTLAPPVALGSFDSGDDLRSALAESFPTGPAPEGGEAPSAAAVDRCATQLTVTLNLTEAATRTGYATVDGRSVLVYEFDAPSFADGTPTTLVAAVGTDACDQVAIFQR